MWINFFIVNTMNILLNALKSFLISNKKFVVVSFPKSGRTWLRVMLDRLNIRLKYTHDRADDLRQLSYRDLGTDKSKYKKKKVIFLTRDPRDTLVSDYFQVTKRFNIYNGTISEFLRDDRFGMKKIIRFHEIWFDNKQVPKDFLLVTYEDMKQDTLNVLKKVTAFLQREYLEDTQLIKTIEFAKFENMQRLEKIGFFSEKYGSKLMPTDIRDRESFKVRKGKIGGYLEYLNENDIKYCDGCMRSAKNSSYREFLKVNYLNSSRRLRSSDLGVPKLVADGG